MAICFIDNRTKRFSNNCKYPAFIDCVRVLYWSWIFAISFIRALRQLCFIVFEFSIISKRSMTSNYSIISKRSITSKYSIISTNRIILKRSIISKNRIIFKRSIIFSSIQWLPRIQLFPSIQFFFQVFNYFKVFNYFQAFSHMQVYNCIWKSGFQVKKVSVSLAAYTERKI